MEHYANLISALGGAMPKCMVWQQVDDDKDKPNEYFNARDIFQLALQLGADEEEMDEDTFYIVSSEGAIGMAVKYDYLTLWMFIPVFDPVIHDRELERLKIELEFDDAVESGRMTEEQAAQEFSARYAQITGQPVELTTPFRAEPSPEAGATMSSFCRSCGQPLRQGAKFCLNCGAKI